MTEQLVINAEKNSTSELKPDQVVIHLGTNDVMYIKASAPTVIVKLGTAMDTINKRFPDATIGLCSIPPRRGNTSEIKQCNATAKIINEYMESLADAQPENYIFFNTWCKLWSAKGHAIKQYYDSDDTKGIHLSKKR